MNARIHDGWLRTTETTPRVEKEQPVRHGIPPMECEACHDYYVPKRAGQKYCTRPECVTRRDRQRQQERRRLQRWMADADQKRQGGISKAQMVEVEQAFRETREARMLKKADDRRRYETAKETER